MVVGVVAIILCCCIVLFLDRYRSAMVQSARTGSAQTVSQVSSTVGNYLRDMDQAMELVVRSMSEPQQSRDELLSAFYSSGPMWWPLPATRRRGSWWSAGLWAGNPGRRSSKISPLT